MKNVFKKSICAIAVSAALSAQPVYAVAADSAISESASTGQTKLFLEVRERFEHQENLNDKFYGNNPKIGADSDSYLLSRIRLGLKHRFNKHWSGKISLQDSRAIDWAFSDKDWKNGEFGGIENNPQHDPLELGATWLQYKNGAFNAKIGRQAIFYGNKRVFGPGAWKNSGKWVWDAAKVRLKHKKHWVDAFYGKTMLHDPNEFSLSHEHGYVGSGLYGHIKASDELVIEPMLVIKYNDDSLNYDEKELFYYGARALLKTHGFKVDATYMQQSGEVSNNGATTDSDALGYNLDVNYRFNPRWMVGASHSFASGDDKGTTDNERFDGVYGASDKYYGRMNLMKWSNLVDYGLLANYRPSRDLELQAEYHQFYADEIKDGWRAYKNGLTASSDHYGNELDLTAKFKLNPSWKLLGGVGVFLPGDAIKQAVDNNQAFLSDDTAYSGFIQVTYRFNQAL